MINLEFHALIFLKLNKYISKDSEGIVFKIIMIFKAIKSYFYVKCHPHT